MGRLEEKSRRRARHGEVQKIILETVKIAGLLSATLIAPNVLSAMNKIGLIQNKRQGEIVKSLSSRLSKKGLLKFNGKYYELTQEGEKRLRQLELVDYKLSSPKKWDKKWRVIIFDIPEKKKKVREKIRMLFYKAGFYLLQDSVWVYPYDCEDVIGLLKADLTVGKNVLYMIVDEIENDKHLREHFALK